jgi:hypothetical protein
MPGDSRFLQQSFCIAVEPSHIAVKNAKEPIERRTKKHVQRKDVQISVLNMPQLWRY